MGKKNDLTSVPVRDDLDLDRLLLPLLLLLLSSLFSISSSPTPPSLFFLFSLSPRSHLPNSQPLPSNQPNTSSPESQTGLSSTSPSYTLDDGVKALGKMVERDGRGNVVLYHGTPAHKVDRILEEGLKGGDNTTGGNRGQWGHPMLFLTPNRHTAERYGTIIEVRIPERELSYYPADRVVDGRGDDCLVLESNDWGTVLVEADYLSCPILDHENGVCDNDTCLICIDEQSSEPESESEPELLEKTNQD